MRQTMPILSSEVEVGGCEIGWTYVIRITEETSGEV